MEPRIRRVRRTWLERLTLWEQAYEARAYRGLAEITERAKTPNAAEALVVKRWTDTEIQIEVRGILIIVTQPTTQFVAIFTKPKNQPRLILMRRTDTNDHVLIAQAWRAAYTKARELDWIA
jgi:hypothetical protein